VTPKNKGEKGSDEERERKNSTKKEKREEKKFLLRRGESFSEQIISGKRKSSNLPEVGEA